MSINYCTYYFEIGDETKAIEADVKMYSEKYLIGLSFRDSFKILKSKESFRTLILRLTNSFEAKKFGFFLCSRITILKS